MVNQGVLDDFSFATYEKLCLEIENNVCFLLFFQILVLFLSHKNTNLMYKKKKIKAYYLCMGWLEHLPLGLVVSQMSDALSQVLPFFILSLSSSYFPLVSFSINNISFYYYHQVENVLMKISQSVKRELNNYQEKIIHQLSVYQSLIKKIATGARKEEVRKHIEITMRKILIFFVFSLLNSGFRPNSPLY